MGCGIHKRSNRLNNSSEEIQNDRDHSQKLELTPLFVVKEESSYMEQSHAASKRQSIARDSVKLADQPMTCSNERNKLQN